MTSEFIKDSLIILISVGATGLVTWLKDMKNEKKRVLEVEALRLENEKTKEDIAGAIENRLREERDDLLEHIKRNGELIKDLESREAEQNEKNKIIIKKLTLDSEECSYQHKVIELILIQLKKHNIFKDWRRDLVFVIDDDEDVLDDFRHKFSKLDILEYRGFLIPMEFMTEVKIHQPPIVVIDYHLGGMTAEDVIKDLGYEPEIFIMSGEKAYSSRFNKKNIRFFVKDNHYVYKIAEEIIKHLGTKN